MDEVQALSKEANPHAISIRIKPRSRAQATGQRRHDLREGRQPAYVDAKKKDLNEVIIKPMTTPELVLVCIDRRCKRETKRAMKRNAAIATVGIITFGVEAQVKFAALNPAIQSAAMEAVAEAIAERLQTTLTGLVIHRDESATHAHFQLPAVNFEGYPITQANSLSDISRLQDLAADVIGRFEPAIERGNKKHDTLKAGASYSEVLNRSVQELHWDIPLELDRKRKRVDEMDAKIAALEAKAEALTAAESKRLAIYRKRHEDRVAELALTEADARAGAEQIMCTETQKVLQDAHTSAGKIKATAQYKAEALVESVGLMLEGKVEGVVQDKELAWRPKIQWDDAQVFRFRLSKPKAKVACFGVKVTAGSRVQCARSAVRAVRAVLTHSPSISGAVRSSRHLRWEKVAVPRPNLDGDIPEIATLLQEPSPLFTMRALAGEPILGPASAGLGLCPQW